MKFTITILLAATAVMTSGQTGVHAATLSSEPPRGALACGAAVYVDDGTCKAGFIKKVVGGCNIRKDGSKIKNAKGRKRSCVKR